MNVEQILKKESLDQMLQLKPSNDALDRFGEDHMLIVGNYLDLPADGSSQSRQQCLNESQCRQITLSFDNPPSCRELQSNSRENHLKKRSVFHNFQKHLMTTLRSHIKIRKISHSNRSQSNIACELWQYLKSSTKTNKRFLLCFLLGREEKGKQMDQPYYEYYNQMLDEFNQYKEEELKSAQAFLCREIIRQCRKLIENGSLEGRRMNRSQEFKKYLEKFLDDLEAGKISKRMPKVVKLMKKSRDYEENIQ